MHREGMTYVLVGFIDGARFSLFWCLWVEIEKLFSTTSTLHAAPQANRLPVASCLPDRCETAISRLIQGGMGV